MLQDIDKDTADDGPLDLHNDKSATIREQAAAFLPMTYDFSAEKLRPQLDEVATERKRIQTKAKTFTEQAAACDAQDEALSKELEELQRTVAESKEAIARLDLDFDKRADTPAKQQAKGGKTDYADAYAKLRPAIEKAANEETDGMIQDAQDAITQNQAALEALKTQLTGMDEAIVRQKDDIAADQK